MTILMSDPEVSAVPVLESGEPLHTLDPSFGPARALVRAGLAERLIKAQALLPAGTGFRVAEGHRAPADQQAIIDRYRGEVAAAFPDVDEPELHRLTSRFVAPMDVAPHVAGAAVDLILVGPDGEDLDLGTVIDATPEQSDGACYFAGAVGAEARANRDLLASALEAVGLVNYPTEWWHWSYGDRYWAVLTGAPAALYGPIDA